MRLCPLLPLLPAVLFTLCARAPARPLNVLLVISDDLRDTVGCYGNTQVHTPNLDGFAREAVRFDRAYAQYPVCNPSRSSFLTGLRPDDTGVLNNTTRPRERQPAIVTWPQHLRRQGWYTGAFGKVFHTAGRTDAERAVWQDRSESWDETFYETAERIPGPKVEGRNLTDGALKWCTWASVDCEDDAMPDGMAARRAIAAIEHAGGKPWFVAVGFHRPHDPFIAPRKYFDLYPAGSLRLKPTPAELSPAPPLAIPGGATKAAFARFTDRERLEFLRAYYAGVSFMDAQFGRVLAAVDRLGGRENTLVIFMGDNGYHLGEREWWNKDTLFERSCRVPLLIRPPAPAASPLPANPAVCPTPVELVDLFPTVLDFLGMTAPGPLAGESLRAQLVDPSRPGRGVATTVVVRGKQRGRTVRTPRWRYTEWTDGGVELYDENEDPEETRNLVADPTHTARLVELKALLTPDRVR